MLYRLAQSKFVFDNHPKRQRPDKPPGVRSSLLQYEYGTHFEQIGVKTKTKPGRLYKAPILPNWRLDVSFISTEEQFLRLPDVFISSTGCAVSAKARAVIDEIDKFEHQYRVLPILDQTGKVLENFEYFMLHVRRYAELPVCDKSLEKLNFIPSMEEEQFLPIIQSSEECRNWLEKQPLCRYSADPKKSHEHYIYMNQKIYSGLAAAGISGIDQYGTNDRNKVVLEAVGNV